MTLAIRGSNSYGDWVSDLTQILPSGAAYDQIVEMYNWWQKVSNPQGTLVGQCTIARGLGSAPPNSVELWAGAYLLQTAPVQATGELSQALALDPLIDVTGHSLGGHLAMAFASIFAADVGQVTVFNAPGFLSSTVNQRFFAGLGGSIPDGLRTTNVIASENGSDSNSFSPIGGLHSRPGVAVDVPIEDQSAWPPAGNHAIALLAESLAAYQLLVQLDPGLTLERYHALLQSSSNRMDASLERVIDGVRALIGIDADPLPTGSAQREALYQAIYALQDPVGTPQFTQLRGNLVFNALEDISVAKARSDFGVFLSLMQLSPLGIGTNQAGAAVLHAVHAAAYQQWAKGASATSDTFLHDRLTLLNASAILNSNDAEVIGESLYARDRGLYIDREKMAAGDRAVQLVDEVIRLVDNPDRAEFAVTRRFVFGTDQADYIEGGAASDRLYGQAGNDTLEGGDGDDELQGGAGNDSYLIGFAGGGAARPLGDIVSDEQGSNTLWVQHGAGGSHMAVRALGQIVGNLYAEPDAHGKPANGTRYLLSGVDLIATTAGGNSVTIEGFLLRDGVVLGDRNANAFGISFSDMIDAAAPATDITVTRLGSASNETDPLAHWREYSSQGGHGWSTTAIRFDADQVQNYNGSPAHGNLGGVFEGGPVGDYLGGDGDANALYGLAGADLLEGGGADDYLAGGAGADTISGGAGHDLIFGSERADYETLFAVQDPIVRGFYFTQARDAASDINWLDGGAGDDLVSGGEHADIIDGGSGWNRLFGGTGSDQIVGGADTDIVYGDSALAYRLTTGANQNIFEHLEIAFADGADTVDRYDDLVTAGGGDDYLWGELGNDTLYGEGGDDLLVGDRVNDRDWFDAELPAYANTSAALATVLHGDDKLYGGAGNDLLWGLGGNDLLDGGAGNDTLVGHEGSNTYLFGRGDGLDTIVPFVDPAAGKLNTLRFKPGVSPGEIIVSRNGADLRIAIEATTDCLVIGSFFKADDVRNPENPLQRIEFSSGTGWTLDQLLARCFTGTAANDTLTGTVTAEAMVGGGGDDSLLGRGGDDTLRGGTGNDTLNGEDGVDMLFGGAGNDSYILGAGDIVVELAGEGIDTVFSAASCTLGEQVENLTLTGSAYAMQGYGNALDNVIRGTTTAAGSYQGTNLLYGEGGNDVLWGEGQDDNLYGGDGNDTLYGDSGSLALALHGSDYLNGGDGDDLMFGFGGNDRYAGFSASSGRDVISDNSGGSDRIEFALDANVDIESMQFTRQGNDLKMTINAGNSITVSGWYANPNNVIESMLVRNQGYSYWYTATQIQGCADGVNTAPVANQMDMQDAHPGQASRFTVPDYAFFDIESQHSLSYTATMADGSPLPAWLSLDAATGEFTALAPADSADQSFPVRLTGWDEGGLSASISFEFAIVRAMIDGTEGDDVLAGSMWNDFFDAMGGDDVLDGLDGADEMWAGEGQDTLYGGAGDDSLLGGEGNDYLDGGVGADGMWGQNGDDIYVVDNTFDRVTEDDTEEDDGVDEVRATISYTLPAFIENLLLVGSAAINGTGNTLSNVLTGNSGKNTLAGLAGNDTLDGGSAGTDVLKGGTGNDTYLVNRSSGITLTENAGEGTDTVVAGVTYTLGNNLENLVLAGSAVINGTGNTLANAITGNSASNILGGGSGADTLVGGAGNDTLDGGSGNDFTIGGPGNDVHVVAQAGDVAAENANEGIDTVNSSITRSLEANIELLFLGGTGAINGTGNTLANLLRGNSANNTLAGGGGCDILEGSAGNDKLSNTSGNTLLCGGAGADTLSGSGSNDLLIGGTGNDTLNTGNGADIIVFNKGDGQDTVAASSTRDNTLSLGGGTKYADLLFQKSGNNLVLKVGSTDQITFTNYYSSASNHSIDRLQLVLEGSTDYNTGSSNPLYNRKIASFDFNGLVGAFDAARTSNPKLGAWALSSALSAQHLGGSNSAAIGGDLAYRYGVGGKLADISFTPAMGILAAGGFGSSVQSLQASASLQDGSPRLS
ncbi:MAG: calcium-binding protein [Pseudomonadales bacterium]